jgi:hypothetical protein
MGVLLTKLLVLCDNILRGLRCWTLVIVLCGFQLSLSRFTFLDNNKKL